MLMLTTKPTTTRRASTPCSARFRNGRAATRKRRLQPASEANTQPHTSMPAKKTVQDPQQPQPTRKKAAIKPEDAVYQLKITLQHSSPPIWRRLLVPGDFLMAELHQVIQAAMPWSNSHMHQFIFRSGREVIVLGSSPMGDFLGDEDELDDNEVTLAQMAPKKPRKFFYEYDFGDSWIHEIVVEALLPPDPAVRAPVCLEGEMACPPDDSGGLWGYYDMLEIIDNPSHPDRSEYREWLGKKFDPKRFDPVTVNRRLARMMR